MLVLLSASVLFVTLDLNQPERILSHDSPLWFWHRGAVSVLRIIWKGSRSKQHSSKKLNKISLIVVVIFITQRTQSISRLLVPISKLSEVVDERRKGLLLKEDYTRLTKLVICSH